MGTHFGEWLGEHPDLEDYYSFQKSYGLDNVRLAPTGIRVLSDDGVLANWIRIPRPTWRECPPFVERLSAYYNVVVELGCTKPSFGVIKILLA